MIYTNLFKVNNSNKIKTSVFYMIEKRKYKFEMIFDSKFTSLLSSITLGAFMVASVNLGVYFIPTSINAKKIAELEVDNNIYNSSLDQLELQQDSYLKQKINADNIYNISSKPTKWSSILDNIANQLPYDTVLTSVTTVSSEDAIEGVSIVEANKNAQGNGATGNNQNTQGSNNNTNPQAGTDNQGNATPNEKTPSENLEEQIATNEGIKENDVIAITGRSLSMVNLSLFLDKLDQLEIFSKVEYLNAEREEDSPYYAFLIYAYLN